MAVILSVEKWQVREMELTQEKVKALWELLQRYPSLFSDLTKGDQKSFVSTLLVPDSVWLEIVDYDVPVGIVWFGELNQVIDTNAHLVFFDRRPAEKLELCKEIVRWMFLNFPLQRITASPPVIYMATTRLLNKMGFTREGTKRKAALIGGKWVDMAIYGITREEVIK